MSRRRVAGVIVRRALIGIVFIAIIGAIFFAVLQTVPARNYLARKVAEMLSSALNSEVAVSAIDGTVPFNVRIAHLSAERAGVTWLEVDDFSLRWSPASLLTGRLSIRELYAGTVTVRPPPEHSRVAQPAHPFPPDMAARMSRITVQKLDIARIELDQQLLGKSAVLQVTARMKRRSRKESGSASVRIATIDGTDDGLIINAEASYAEPHAVITVDISARKLPWRSVLLENVGFHARLTEDFGTPAGLQGNAVFSAVGLPIARQDGPVPVAIAVEATLTNGLFTLSAHAVASEHDAVRANCSVPVEVSLAGMTARAGNDANISGMVRGTAKMESFALLVPLHEQLLSGDLDIGLTLGGSVRNPSVAGMAALRNGSYENLVLGTVLSNMDIELIAKDGELTVSGTAKAGTSRGIVRLSGSIMPRPSKQYPFDMALQFDNAVLVQRDDVTAAFSGQLNVVGSGVESRTTGHLQIVSGELNIPERLPVEIVVIDEVDASAPDVVMEDLPPTLGPQQLHKAAIDLQVTTKDRVAVRGRGLDSQWTTDFHVAGSVRKPSITGECLALRGRFDLLGRSFRILSGKIVLDGASPPAPRIDAVGEAKGGGITAFARISGPLASPQITLESNPTLPVDEILARLLFRRSVSSITPLHALQLAAVVQSLVGGGSSILDVMDRARRVMGLDQLTVNSEGQKGEQATSVTLGKSIGSRVYIEPEANTTPGNDRVSVAIQITPELSFQSETGSQLRDGVSIKWQRDY